MTWHCRHLDYLAAGEVVEAVSASSPSCRSLSVRDSLECVRRQIVQLDLHLPPESNLDRLAGRRTHKTPLVHTWYRNPGQLGLAV